MKKPIGFMPDDGDNPDKSDEVEIPNIVLNAIGYVDEVFSRAKCFAECDEPISYNELFFRISQAMNIDVKYKFDVYEQLRIIGFETENIGGEVFWLLNGK